MDTQEILRALAAMNAQYARIVEQMTQQQQEPPQRKPPTRARVIQMKRAAA